MELEIGFEPTCGLPHPDYKSGPVSRLGTPALCYTSSADLIDQLLILRNNENILYTDLKTKSSGFSIQNDIVR